MAYKVCSSCGKHVRDTEPRCWHCQSVEFVATAVPAPAVPAPAPLSFMDKVRAANAKAQQKVADEKDRKQSHAMEQQKQQQPLRTQAFEQARRNCPLPLIPEKMPIAGGLELFNDEFVVSVGKEWGWTSAKLTLTTHRVLWSIGVFSTSQKSLYLTDIRDVVYHRPVLGLPTIAFETAAGGSMEGLPAAKNGTTIRDQLMAMIHWARQREHQKTAPEPTVSIAPQPPDRLDQLRRLGELKAQGVLSDEEFLVEKTKVLAQA